jgi:hypothetical protein
MGLKMSRPRRCLLTARSITRTDVFTPNPTFLSQATQPRLARRQEEADMSTTDIDHSTRP